MKENFTEQRYQEGIDHWYSNLVYKGKVYDKPADKEKVIEDYMQHQNYVP